jgi:hypothetical protein
MSEDRILEALNALKEADEAREANPFVEARLLDAFRKHRSRNVRRRVTAGVAVVAAAVLVGVIERPKPAPVGQTIVVQWSVSPGAPKAPADDKTRSSAPRRLKKPAPLREIATGFYPLLDVQPPFERGELVRVVVPAETMRSVGLPVREDHLTDMVQADVLVGQEGLARAIRFVGFEK